MPQACAVSSPTVGILSAMAMFRPKTDGRQEMWKCAQRVVPVAFNKCTTEAPIHFSMKVCVGVITLTIGVLSCAAQGCMLGKGVVLVQKDIAARLRYRLIDKFGPLRFCDFDCAGACRMGNDSKHVDEVFAQIRQDTETFTAIAQHLGLQTTRDFSLEQNIAVYRQYEELACGMTFEHQGKDYTFKLLGANGFSVEGQIKRNGEINVTDEKLGGLNCPK